MACQNTLDLISLDLWIL